MPINTPWRLPSIKPEDVANMRKWVRRFVNIERPGMTNGTDSFVEWYENSEEEEEAPLPQEDENKS